MTELAYLADEAAMYGRRFTSRVVALPPGAVVLDRTLFYPTGGGQPCDLGWLRRPDGGGAWPVADVTKSGSGVLHRLGRARPSSSLPLRIGESLDGELDWSRRYVHMRLHSAQHLLSAVVYRAAGVRTRQASVFGSGGTLDLERTLPTPFAEIEEECRRRVDRGLPIRVRWVPREEWDRFPSARSGLVGLPAAVDPVRLIEIEDVDSCPCGGTHVRSTAEIGRLALHPTQPVSGGVRLPFILTSDAPPTPTE